MQFNIVFRVIIPLRLKVKFCELYPDIAYDSFTDMKEHVTILTICICERIISSYQ